MSLKMMQPLLPMRALRDSTDVRFGQKKKVFYLHGLFCPPFSRCVCALWYQRDARLQDKWSFEGREFCKNFRTKKFSRLLVEVTQPYAFKKDIHGRPGPYEPFGLSKIIIGVHDASVQTLPVTPPTEVLARSVAPPQPKVHAKNELSKATVLLTKRPLPAAMIPKTKRASLTGPTRSNLYSQSTSHCVTLEYHESLINTSYSTLLALKHSLSRYFIWHA